MKYRTVSPSMWTTRAFRALPPGAPSAQLLYAYLLTGPETTAVPGFIPVGPGALAESLRWSPAALDRQLEALERVGLARIDREARLIVLPTEVANARCPANPNVATHWASAVAEGPDCDLRDDVARQLFALVQHNERLAEPFRQRFGERLAEPSRNQNQYQEQDQKQSQDQTRELGSRERAKPPRRSSCPGSDASSREVEEWASSEEIDPSHPEFPRFLDHHRAKGSTFADWGAAFRTWKDRAREYSRPAARAANSNALMGQQWEGE